MAWEGNPQPQCTRYERWTKGSHPLHSANKYTLLPPTLGPFHTCFFSPGNAFSTELSLIPCSSFRSWVREAFLNILGSVGSSILFLHWGQTLSFFVVVYLCD